MVPCLSGKVEGLKKKSTICGLSIRKTFTILSTGLPSSIRTLSFPYSMFPQTSSLNKFLHKSCPAKVFPLLLAPITPFLFVFNVSVVVHFSITKTLYTSYTIALKPPWPLLPFSTKHLPPTLFKPTLPCLTSPSCNLLKKLRTQPLPLSMPLQFPGLHYLTRNSPWTPPFMPLQ